ncbi:MAG TPA: hypothetical protein VIH91_09140 [Terriglobales bacterium]
MPTRLFQLVVVIAAICAPWAQGESTDCTTPVLLIADGRITQSTFPLKTTYWYGIDAQIGHSYSVEFEPPADNYLNATRVQFATLSVFGPGDTMQGCRGSSSVAVTQNSGYAPVILKNGNGAGRRVSFTAQSAGLHLIGVTNVAGAGSYSFRALDTTLFNLRWSTRGGYGDQWGFLNVSDMPVTGVLTIYDWNNAIITSVRFTIPVTGEVTRNASASDLHLPDKSNGFAMFSHNGPPGAIIADAYMISSNGAVVTYTKFENRGTR